MPAYADLEISLRRRGEGTYAAELRFNAPDSEAERRILLDDAAALKIDLAALRVLEPDWDAYGAALGKALLSGDLGKELSDARKQAQGKEAVLRMRLLIEANASELNNVHWETLRDPANGAPLLASEQIAFSRYLSSMDWRRVRSRPRSDLKALVVVSNPSNLEKAGFAPVDVESEVARAKAALGVMEVKTLVSPGGPTVPNLIRALSEGVDILYLVCHGKLFELDSRMWEPRLYLEAEDGRIAAASGPELVRLIADLETRPRLVVLASCQSSGLGIEGKDDRAEGLAAAFGPQLAQAGIPAVVAMRGNISMLTVEKFMPVFFSELAKDGQIDAAMAKARREVMLLKRPDYWIPVLYMRLKSGRIWYVPGFGGEKAEFENWKSICSFVSDGRFVPLVGPEIAENVFGDTRDIATQLALDNGFPLSNFERADLAKVTQFIQTHDSVQFMRGKVISAMMEGFQKRFPDQDPDGAMAEILKDKDHPYTILAGLKNAKVYVTASADPMLEIALIQSKRTPVPMVSKWRDERREERGDPEVKSDPKPENPLLYYVFGKLPEDENTPEKEQTWVLSEDDFFDYLIRTTKYDLMPLSVGFHLTTSSLMFLGFPLDDWKFRVLFRMIMAKGGSGNLSGFNHVGVQVNPDETTLADAQRAKKYLEKYFKKAEIGIYWGTSADFLKELRSQLERHVKEVPPAKPAGGFFKVKK